MNTENYENELWGHVVRMNGNWSKSRVCFLKYFPENDAVSETLSHFLECHRVERVFQFPLRCNSCIYYIHHFQIKHIMLRNFFINHDKQHWKWQFSIKSKKKKWKYLESWFYLILTKPERYIQYYYIWSAISFLLQNYFL